MGASASLLQLAEDLLEESHLLDQNNSLDRLMERIGNARYVLLGEASHGTSEYYLWRATISKRLIAEKGFSFIAVEGDWPDCYAINQYIKDDKPREATDVLKNFNRWPDWMWANWEIASLLEWLKDYNSSRPLEEKIGFYGLDMYSLWESLEVIDKYAKEKQPALISSAENALKCFEPYERDIYAYARRASFIPDNCREEVVGLLHQLQEKAAGSHDGREDIFNAEQNAMVAVNAENYYRKMIDGGNITWNIRDQHMMETLNRLMEHHGKNAKCIVWEHNTHIGDARATDMARAGMYNTGQLAREQHGREDVVLVGFGSYSGSVIAGSSWGAPMQVMEVPQAKPGSWEDILHRADQRNRLLILDTFKNNPDWMKKRGHRAIGVVYDPETEHIGNFVPTILPERYDAFIFIDRTHALHPLKKSAGELTEIPDTYPFGV